jgi:hypothetical protein
LFVRHHVIFRRDAEKMKQTELTEAGGGATEPATRYHQSKLDCSRAGTKIVIDEMAPGGNL